MTKDKKNRTQRVHVDLILVRHIFQACLEYLEKHKELTGFRMTNEEALVLMWVALFQHFHSNFAPGNAVEIAYAKIFHSRLAEIFKDSSPRLITRKLQENYNLYCEED